jgi:hypothetical protein
LTTTITAAGATSSRREATLDRIAARSMSALAVC